MSSLIIVYDTVTPIFLGNRILDGVYAAQFAGASSIACLRDLAAQRGWQMMTADVFLQTRPACDLALCISERVTPRTDLLIDCGVIPAVITCGESPNVDWRFYHYISVYTKKFKHVFIYRGARERVKPPTQFHTLYFPNASRDVLPGLKWTEREFMVMIASNKHRIQVAPDRPFIRMRELKRRFIWSCLQIVDPLFRFKDLYKERLPVIRYFSAHPGFRLYGAGWDGPISGFNVDYQRMVQKAYAGPLEYTRKLETMRRFKYAICFENCEFPGHITEKIFDCFLAGCIPIYYGAPDITDFVPAETLIDFRKFRDMIDLDQYLRGLSEAEAHRYLEAARDFLVSAAFDKFYQGTFVNELLDILEQECESIS